MKKTILILLALTVGFMSCQKEEILNNNAPKGPQGGQGNNPMPEGGIIGWCNYDITTYTVDECTGNILDVQTQTMTQMTVSINNEVVWWATGSPCHNVFEYNYVNRGKVLCN